MWFVKYFPSFPFIALAHLAYAMGNPVWILLLKPLDPRCGLTEPECCWYSLARLLRQLPLATSYRSGSGRIEDFLSAVRIVLKNTNKIQLFSHDVRELLLVLKLLDSESLDSGLSNLSDEELEAIANAGGSEQRQYLEGLSDEDLERLAPFRK